MGNFLLFSGRLGLAMFARKLSRILAKNGTIPSITAKFMLVIPFLIITKTEAIKTVKFKFDMIT